MILKIDMAGETPIYIQLRNEIVKGIGRGELEEGENLPTVRQLASELGVNTMTVSKAYQLLKSEGFIETDRRKGAVVRPARAMDETAVSGYREHLGDELELLSAEARLRGVKREDFLKLCEDAFAEMGV